MDLQRAKTFLNKINRLYAMLEDSESVSSIERDLMLSYTRSFYEALLAEETTKIQQKVAPTRKTYEPKKENPVIYPKPRVPVTSKGEPVKVKVPEIRVPNTKPVIKEEPKVVTPPIIKETPKPRPKPKPQPVVSKPKPKPEPKPQPVVTKPKSIPVSKPIPSKYDVLFKVGAVTDLSEKLSSSPIKNLKSAMGINERFLTVNELFGGNMTKFNETLDILNGFDKFSQAQAYLTKIIAPEHDWLDEEKQERAKDFIKKVYRRYL